MYAFLRVPERTRLRPTGLFARLCSNQTVGSFAINRLSFGLRRCLEPLMQQDLKRLRSLIVVINLVLSTYATLTPTDTFCFTTSAGEHLSSAEVFSDIDFIKWNRLQIENYATRSGIASCRYYEVPFLSPSLDQTKGRRSNAVSSFLSDCCTTTASGDCFR